MISCAQLVALEPVRAPLGIPGLHRRLGTAFPWQPTTKLGMSRSSAHPKGWGRVLAGLKQGSHKEPVPSCSDQAKRQKMLLGPTGCPHSCPAWAAPSCGIHPR